MTQREKSRYDRAQKRKARRIAPVKRIEWTIVDAPSFKALRRAVRQFYEIRYGKGLVKISKAARKRVAVAMRKCDKHPMSYLTAYRDLDVRINYEAMKRLAETVIAETDVEV